MESDEGKLFIGGIAWDTTEDKLSEYFNQYGDVSQAVIMRDKTTGRPRGFGFVVFSDPSVLDQVLQDKHTIDGRTVSLTEISYFLLFFFGRGVWLAFSAGSVRFSIKFFAGFCCFVIKENSCNNLLKILVL